MTLRALEQLPGSADIASLAYFIKQGETVLADGTRRLHIDEWEREMDVAIC